MKANYDFLISELKANANSIRNLLSINSAAQAHWKPSHDKWCLLEIVCHLVDEEILDFRTRVKTALFPDQFTFVPIDPVGWVTSKEYLKQDYRSKVEEWVHEREASLDWLRSLESPNWSSSLVHDQLGEMSAGLFLENWLAHDHIHIRQINRTKRAYLAHLAHSDLSYSGKW